MILKKHHFFQAVQKRLDTRRPSTGSGQALKSVMVSLSNHAAQHADTVPAPSELLQDKTPAGDERFSTA